MKCRNGFTLIEIIIVVVILGILAAVALPKITENIDKARAAEAFTFAATIGRVFDRCVSENLVGVIPTTVAQVANCDDYRKLGFIDPETGALPASGATRIKTNNFYYDMAVWDPVTDPGAPNVFLEIIPKLRPELGGNLINDGMNIRYHADGKNELMFCGGKFSKMCK